MLAAHPRATHRGSLIVDPAHWDGLPDGHTRAVTLDPVTSEPSASPATAPTTTGAQADPLAALLTSRPAAATAVAHRPLGAYDAAAGLTPPGSFAECQATTAAGAQR